MFYAEKLVLVFLSSLVELKQSREEETRGGWRRRNAGIGVEAVSVAAIAGWLLSISVHAWDLMEIWTGGR